MKLAPILFGLITLSAHAYQTDSIGNIQYNKPSQTIQNDGRIIILPHGVRRQLPWPVRDNYLDRLTDM